MKAEICVLKSGYIYTYPVTARHHSNHNVAAEHLSILTQSFPGLEFGLEHEDQQLSEGSKCKGSLFALIMTSNQLNNSK